MHRESKRPRTSPQWTDYHRQHVWVKRNFGKPNKCEDCGLEKKRYEWANISGKYNYERSDWKMLCHQCHMRFDYIQNHGKTDEQIRNPSLTVNEFASLGGKARWKKITKKQRSIAMKKVRRGSKLLSTVTTQNSLDTSKHVE